MSSFAIETALLTREFARLRAVDQLSLQVPKGTIFGFLGPNGAGKTTTIRLLLGLLEPTSGSGQVLGFDIRTQAQQIRQECGALLEFNGLYQRLSAEDNLDFYGRVWRIPAAQRKERIRSLLSATGLWERRKEVVGAWSRGMRQKLAVARALFHHPQLVFLDEPTAGLDPVAAATLREELAGMVAAEGVTVFLTTHNLTEAEKLCHQVGIIRSGKLLAVGSLAELRQQAGGSRLEITGSGFSPDLLQQVSQTAGVIAVESTAQGIQVTFREPFQTAPLVQLLVQGGAAVEEVRKGAPTLEDAFLTLMQDKELTQ